MRYFARLSLLLAVVAFSLSAVVFSEEPREKVLFVDRFDSKLADGWSWTKENPQTRRIEKDALVIKTAPGNIWDKSAENVLWRSAGSVPEGTTWYAEVTVAHKPETEYEQAGLICSLDDDNFFTLNIELYHGQRSVVSGGRVEGKFNHFGNVENQQDAVRLRIAKKGKTVQLQWREADEWKTLKEFDFPATGDLKIGLHTHGAKNETDNRWATFTDFELLRYTP
jgi:regulation of enolase protein 1 (concanavalin A-like superfamily)